MNDPIETVINNIINASIFLLTQLSVYRKILIWLIVCEIIKQKLKIKIFD